jgi:hypothetical protein
MTTDIKYCAIQITAGADLDTPASRFKAVTVGGTIAASANWAAAGILRHGGKTGETLSVIYEGITKVLAGGAITSGGLPIKITTSGFIIAAASGDVSIGRALAPCASGDLVQAFVDFKNLGFWHG